MVAEYYPIDDDGTASFMMSSDEHRSRQSSSSLNLLPLPNESLEAQSLITTINVREEYEQQHATASPGSCVINLANTILGTGMLAMVCKQ